MIEVSVIVPVYNAEKYIKRCVESLLAQSFREFEIIFVNDGSTDKSKDMLMQYKEESISIRIVDKENGGQGSARNAGIKEAKSEFLVFVDIDDYVKEDMLLKLYEKQRKTNADIVWCDALKVKADESLGTLDQDVNWTKNDINDYFLNNASPWRKLIRTSLIKENDLYFPNIRFYEDVAVVPAYGLYAKIIAYVSEPLYYYDLHEGSTMHQVKYDKRLECVFEALDILKKHYVDSNISNGYHDALEFIYIDHLLHAASLRFFMFDEGKKELDKIVEVFKKDYPKWMNNVYYKQKGLKYRIICYLFYKKQYWLLNKLLK